MNRWRPVLIMLLSAFVWLGSSFAYGATPDVIVASRHDTSPPFAQLAGATSKISGGSNKQAPTARPSMRR